MPTKRPTTTTQLAQLTTELRQRDDDLELLQERLAELELSLEDSGWHALGGDGTHEFSREAITRIGALARLMYLKNPLIQRGVQVQAAYVWAQGCTIQAVDPEINDVIQAFLDEPRNRAELTGPQAQIEKEIDQRLSGNTFLVLFTNPSTGAVRVRSIPPDEVLDIISNPDDAKEVWYYKRTWQQRTLNTVTGLVETVKRTAYYPNWLYQPTQRPTSVGGAEVRWDSPVYHIKTGGLSDQRFGVAEVYAALDWARAYKAFLEDWASITRAYARFAFKITTGGGKKGVAAAKTKMATTLGTGGLGIETNPPSTVGATFVASDEVKIDPVRTGGATTKAEDGRRMLLMVAAAMGLPETFFGDASVGSLATAQSLDRPTELAMITRQSLWTTVLLCVLNYVLLHAVKAPQGPLRGKASIVRDGTTEHLVWPDSTDPRINVDWPPIVQTDAAQRVNSIMSAAAKVPQPKLIARLLLSALGVPDIDELLDTMFDADGQPLNPEPAPTPPPTTTGAAAPTATDAETDPEEPTA